MQKLIDDFETFLLRENKNTPTDEEYIRALKDISPLIPQISHKIINDEGLDHNEENIIILNKEIVKKVKTGDEEILDSLWDLAWSGIMKNAINIITFYHKNNIN